MLFSFQYMYIYIVNTYLGPQLGVNPSKKKNKKND